MQESKLVVRDTNDAPFRAAGVVSLLSDFGLQDPYVGVMHGVLVSRGSELRVIDLTHGVEPQNVLQAGYFLSSSYAYLPAGTVHVAVVDPGVGSQRRILAATWREHGFLAPDNGLLGYVLDDEAEVRALDVERFALPQPSNTFHGRDVFAPAAAQFARGLDLEELGPRVDDWERASLPRGEELPDGSFVAQVLFGDRFGNLITSLRLEQLDQQHSWTLELNGCSLPLRSTYADVAVGDALGLIGSSGNVEVSVRDGSALARFDVGAGAKVTLRRSTR